ncbi:MAG TPA: WXG100 family type VII secretion target [Candidatus Faecisoma merdavium]|nr:WXG100 family type VII secretion target [Candidatus Faecisoma merdavium]
MDIKINYEETISVGNQVSEKGSEFQELLNRIKSVNSELQTYWQGSDASKYSNSVAQQAEYMQQLTNTINEIGNFLVKVGNAYREACENNANAIK